jgi:murein DD-endopeptidase MepM/ murein hydrolase activator NlpD
MLLRLLFSLVISTQVFALDIIESAVNGGVKIIDFTTPNPSPQVYFYDKKVLTQKIKDAHFRAFVGIPVGASLGTHSITIDNNNIDFAIKDGGYHKQYITLSGDKKKYVDLNAKQLARVNKESKLLKNAKQTWSRQILANKIIKPTDGTITGVFGSQRFFNNKPRRPHSGIDFANSVGTKISAITTGKVILTGDFYFNGKTIVIDHGQGFLSFYVHLNDILVNIGDEVETGKIIGLMGSTGRSTGPHLHISTYLNQVAVNPALFFKL